MTRLDIEDKAVRDKLQKLARWIDKELPIGWGFILLSFAKFEKSKHMKKLLLVLALTCASLTIARAQLGLTEEQCAQQDGIIFHNGIASSVTIDILGTSRAKHELREIRKLLIQNSGGSTWKTTFKEYEGDKYGWEISWKTTDGKRTASYHRGILYLSLAGFDPENPNGQ